MNETFADAAAEIAPDGAAVLVQDYHLALVGPACGRGSARPAHRALPPHALVRARRPPTAADRRRPRSSSGLAGQHGVRASTPDRWADAFERVAPRRSWANRATTLSSRRSRPIPTTSPRRPVGGVRASNAGSLDETHRRPQAHRPRRPHRAVEEHPARVPRVRRAARRCTPSGGSRVVFGALLLPVARGAARVPRVPAGGRRAGGPTQQRVGDARRGRRSCTTLSDDFPPLGRRAPAAPTCCWSTRSATASTSWPRRACSSATRVLVLSTEAGACDELGDAGVSRQPVRRGGHRRRVARGAAHGRRRTLERHEQLHAVVAARDATRTGWRSSSPRRVRPRASQS